MEEQLQNPGKIKVKIDKEKIKNWLKQPSNLLLLAILIFAFVLRFHYFWLTKTQPLWWDEASYGSLAKNYISHKWDGTEIIIGETKIRPPLFPLLWSILLRLNIEEVLTRFLLEFIPSILAVFSIYLIVNEVYGKKPAFISTLIFSVLWIHLFYTGRILTDVPALAFLFFSIYFFLKSNKSEFKPKLFAISLMLLGLGTLMRYPIGLGFPAFLSFLLITKQFKLIKNKSFWLSGIVGMLPILVFFVYNYLTQGNIFPAFFGGAAETVQKKFAFDILKFVSVYLTKYFLIFFLFGLSIILFELIISYDIINKNQRLRGHSIFLILFVFVFAYFIFYIRAAEDRWLLPASLPMVALAGLGLSSFSDWFKKYSKYLGLVLIVIIFVFGAQAQLKIADELIKDRKQSFLQIRQGFEWLNDKTLENDIILGQGIQVYAVFYAERQYEKLPETIEEMNNLQGDYLVVHAFSGQPAWINDYLEQNQKKWLPINAYFFDEAQQQTALVIYKNQL